MAPRFFCPQRLEAGALAELPLMAAHHAERVLRLREGDDVVLFDGMGGEYRGRLAEGGRSPRVLVLEHRAVEREAPIAIVLAQAVPAGDRMDWLVQKAVELGVAAIAPLQTERSVVRLSGDRAAKRRAHWQQVAVGACEQCGRNRVPAVHSVIEVRRFLAESGSDEGSRLMLDPRAAAELRHMDTPGGRISLLIGPEGGITESEAHAARARGFLSVRLGPRTLRADTAGLAAVAAILARWGDF